MSSFRKTFSYISVEVLKHAEFTAERHRPKSIRPYRSRNEIWQLDVASAQSSICAEVPDVDASLGSQDFIPG